MRRQATLGIAVAASAAALIGVTFWPSATTEVQPVSEYTKQPIAAEYDRAEQGNIKPVEEGRSDGTRSPLLPGNLGELTSIQRINGDLTLNQYSGYHRQVLAVGDKDKKILLPCPLAYPIFKQREASLKRKLYGVLKAKEYRSVSGITMANYSDMNAAFKSGLLGARGFSSLSQEDRDVVFSALHKYVQACLEELVPEVLKDIHERKIDPGLPLPDYLKAKGPLHDFDGFEEQEDVF